MERTAFVKRIVSLALQSKGKVFGGYVRDLIAGVEFNDIDIAFWSEEEIFDFLSKLSDDFDVSISKKEDAIYWFNGEDSGHFCTRQLVVKSEGECVELHCTTVMKHLPDVSVNRLFLQKVNGEEVLKTFGDYKLNTVLAQIAKRVFVPEHGVNTERVKKIESKGYKKL